MTHRYEAITFEYGLNDERVLFGLRGYATFNVSWKKRICHNNHSIRQLIQLVYCNPTLKVLSALAFCWFLWCGKQLMMIQQSENCSCRSFTELLKLMVISQCRGVKAYQFIQFIFPQSNNVIMFPVAQYKVELVIGSRSSFLIWHKTCKNHAHLKHMGRK